MPEKTTTHKGPDYGGTAADRERDTVSPAKQEKAMAATTQKPHEFAQWVIENPDECSVVEKTLATGYQRLEEQLEAQAEIVAAAREVYEGWLRGDFDWDRLAAALSSPAISPKEDA